MSLSPGTRLGPYEIQSAIGAGGMGEVYRARDTRLKRDVALKILPESFASDADRLARFQREAEVLASLNHSNIAQIHGVEESNGTRALIMELVEGEDLSQRIARGPIPLDEVLPIAKQIAEALEAAHEQGIIHRDLKPANIKVRPDGTVKVLDFGLAKLTESNAVAAGVPNALSMSPTITSPALMSGVGVLLGTAAYMSPEQAKGRPADKRSDIWAFGCVLFEMLTGSRVFDAEDVSDTLALVLKGDPDWTKLPADVPRLVRSFLQRCLERDRKRRIGDISTALFAMSEEASAATSGSAASAIPVVSRPLWRRAIPVVTAALLAGVLVGIVERGLRPSMPRSNVARFSYTLPDGQRFTDVFFPSVAISPDGTQLAYVANRRLYLRSMSELVAKPVSGTETQTNMGSPVFSPDGRAIAYWTRTGEGGAKLTGISGALRRIATSGGASVTIAQTDNIPLGLRWDADGILFGQVDHGIVRVPASGGKAELLVSGRSGEATSSPQMLPGGEALLFTVATAENGTVALQDTWDHANIVVQSLKSGERKTVVAGGSDARYLPTGHVVYVLGGVLFAVPFDVKRLAITGGPVPIVEGVSRTFNGPVSIGSAQISVSENGSIVYLPGPTSESPDLRDLVLIDRNGSTELLKLPSRPYQNPRVSPDGRQVAFFTDDGKEAVVWIYDLSGASAMRRLTLEGKNCCPIWSPDGQRVAFQSDRDGDLAIFWQRADGSAAAERLTRPSEGAAHLPESWSPDGMAMLFAESKGSTSSLWTLSLKNRTATPFGAVQSTVPPSSDFSPDGRWVAYTVRPVGELTRTTLEDQIFVQPFPSNGAKYLVPDRGVSRPRWSRDGKELFFSRGEQVVVVSVTAQKGFTLGNPIPLPVFYDRTPLHGGSFLIGRGIDVMPDGRRFIGPVRPSGTTATTPQIQVVLNWFTELQQRVPVK